VPLFILGVAMNNKIPDFYPNEIVVGNVIAMKARFAVLNVCGWQLPLETRFIAWDALRHPNERLAIGQRLEVVVNDQRIGEIAYRLGILDPVIRWQGYWLSRLPLLDDFWPQLHAKYPVGSVIEVEFIGYSNPYVARAKTPEGFIIELLNNDLHPRRGNVKFNENFEPGQRIELVVRELRRRSFWLQRYTAKSTAQFLVESGYSSPRLLG
jgi:ribosomal protein S1